METSKSWNHLSTEDLGVGGGAEVAYWGVMTLVGGGRLWVGEGQTSLGEDMELWACMRQRSSAHFPHLRGADPTCHVRQGGKEYCEANLGCIGPPLLCSGGRGSLGLGQGIGWLMMVGTL